MRLNNVIKYDGNYAPNEEGFYLLCLVGNTYAIGHGNINRRINISSDCYIDGIREKDFNKYRQHKNVIGASNMPFVSVFQNYEAIPVIGKYENKVMKDYLTGKIVKYIDIASDEITYGLAYYAAFKLPNEIVFDVVDLLNSDDIYKYRKAIKTVDDVAINNANDKKLVYKRKNRGHM